MNGDGIEKEKISYLKVFIVSFCIFTLSILPLVIANKGVWIFYGDFNVQQIPFYMHVHEAIRNGRFFYDYGTDLSGSFIGCFSFYLYASPFFLITIPFKTVTIPYLMPWISALKLSVMAVSAFAFCKKRVSDNAAFIAALLYAFSGFSGAVLVYNHFHDVMAFFPLYLLLFERMLEKKKGIGFTLMTAFMVILNYYFFVGEAVFLIIYFFCVYWLKERKLKNKLLSLLRAFLHGLCGVLLSGVYILPAVYYTLFNRRLSDTLIGYDLIAYSEPTTIWAIVKSVFMLPDLSGLNSMLNQSYSRVSGIGAYLPLFSMSCVIAFFGYKKEKDGFKRLLVTCLVFSAIPVLNSMFSAFNSEFYARWYYMPILIMALLTGEVIDKREETLPYIKKGFVAVSLVTAVLTVISVLPARTEEGELTVLGALKNYEQLIEEIIFCLVMLIFLYIYIRKLSKKSDRVSRIVVMAACLITFATMMVSGMLLVDKERRDGFRTQALTCESPLPEDGTFYRIETDEDFYNYPMLWENAHSITSFISTIPNSIFDLYDGLSIPRKVTSHPYATRIGFRAILSSKYYLTNNEASIERIGRLENIEDLKGYSFYKEEKGFNLYENENFIPFGFSFDEYILDTEYRELELSNTVKDRILAKYVIVSSNDKEDIEGICSHIDVSKIPSSVSYKDFSKYCKKRRENTCENVKLSDRGFSAEASLDKDSLLFFSIPYEDGFSAFIDGKETKIYKVDFGLMAVKAPKGKHTVEFSYVPSYINEGIKMTILGAILFLILIVKNILTLKRDYAKFI